MQYADHVDRAALPLPACFGFSLCAEHVSIAMSLTRRASPHHGRRNPLDGLCRNSLLPTRRPDRRSKLGWVRRRPLGALCTCTPTARRSASTWSAAAGRSGAAEGRPPVTGDSRFLLFRAARRAMLAPTSTPFRRRGLLGVRTNASASPRAPGPHGSFWATFPDPPAPRCEQRGSTSPTATSTRPRRRRSPRQSHRRRLHQPARRHAGLARAPRHWRRARAQLPQCRQRRRPDPRRRRQLHTRRRRRHRRRYCWRPGSRRPHPHRRPKTSMVPPPPGTQMREPGPICTRRLSFLELPPHSWSVACWSSARAGTSRGQPDHPAERRSTPHTNPGFCQSTPSTRATWTLLPATGVSRFNRAPQ